MSNTHLPVSPLSIEAFSAISLASKPKSGKTLTVVPCQGKNARVPLQMTVQQITKQTITLAYSVPLAVGVKFALYVPNQEFNSASVILCSTTQWNHISDKVFSMTAKLLRESPVSPAALATNRLAEVQRKIASFLAAA